MKTVSVLPIETAHLLSARLEEAGIEAVVLDEAGGALITGAGLSHARIQVEDDDFAPAQAIADAFDKEIADVK